MVVEDAEAEQAAEEEVAGAAAAVGVGPVVAAPEPAGTEADGVHVLEVDPATSPRLDPIRAPRISRIKSNVAVEAGAVTETISAGVVASGIPCAEGAGAVE